MPNLEAREKVVDPVYRWESQRHRLLEPHTRTAAGHHKWWITGETVSRDKIGRQNTSSTSYKWNVLECEDPLCAGKALVNVHVLVEDLGVPVVIK